MSNIQVVVRCRGRNQQEIAAKSPIVLDLTDDTYSTTEPYISMNQLSSSNGINGRASTTHDTASNISQKTYKFDQIYGSQADQDLIYSHVALPLLSDFLQGTNVSVLAYGQTGTGKTYTMCGLNSNNKMDELPLPEVAGIIPRALYELFEKLEYMGDDYMVKVSYLEIYNEELTDLLSNHNRKLRVHEWTNSVSKIGPTQKSISIQNLSESCINNYAEGIKLLKMGFTRKKTAATNMNETSSRSHTIFCIQLYRKDASDESMYRVSKMNLVDLAGSENISRSGSIAKEAGGINQSLLALGRVINALNDRKLSQHIPYRESKLTHILQDSLGGGTKTTLIATVSPAQINAMETCSTLDYASKAKNIKNTPLNGHDSEVILKKTLVKNLSNEISQLNSDLLATRNKNGIYLDQKSYKNLLLENESLRTQMKESSLRIESLNKKCDALDQLRIENTEEVSTLRSQNETLGQKVGIIESKLQDALTKLSQRDQTINSLTGKLKQVLEKSSNSATMLITLFSNHLNASVNLLRDTIAMQSGSTSASSINEFQEKFSKDLQEFRDDLQSRTHSFQEHIQGKLTEDLQTTFDSLQESVDSLFSLQQKVHINTQEAMTDLKLANEKLSGYLKEDYLTSVEESIRKRHTEVLQNDFNSLCDNMKHIINKEIEKAILNAMKNSDTATREELAKERSHVLEFEKNWKHQVDESLPRIQKEMQESSSAFETSTEKLRKLNSQGSQIVGSILKEKFSMSLDSLPDITQLPAIAKSVKSFDDSVLLKLRDIRNNLLHIQQFDAKGAFEISPLKSKLDQLPHCELGESDNSSGPTRGRRSLSLSPVKSNRSSSPSKIPTIKRSNTNVADDEKSKRLLNKILQLSLFGTLRMIEVEHLLEKLPIFAINLFLNLATGDQNILLNVLLMGIAMTFKVVHVIMFDRLDLLNLQIFNKLNDDEFGDRVKLKDVIGYYIGSVNFWLNILLVAVDFSVAKFLVYDVFQGVNSFTCLLFGFQFAVQGVEALTNFAKLLLGFYEIVFYKVRRNNREVERERELAREGVEEVEEEVDMTLEDAEADGVEANEAEANEADGTETDAADADEAEEGEIEIDNDDDNELDYVWENKPYYGKAIDISSAVLTSISYICFIYLLTIHSGLSLPLSMLQGTYSSLRKAWIQISQLMSLIESSKRLDTQLPNATKEDLERSDNSCLICLDDMYSVEEYHRLFKKPQAPRRAPKKLQCNHILHMGCLKEWLERSDSCPLCRRKVFGPRDALSQGQPRTAQQQDANPQAQPEFEAEPEVEPQPQPEYRPELPRSSATRTTSIQEQAENSPNPSSNNDAASIIATVDRQTEILRNAAVSHNEPVQGTSRDLEPTRTTSVPTLSANLTSSTSLSTPVDQPSELAYQTINLPSTAVIPPDWVLLPLESTEEEGVEYKVSLSTERKANLKIHDRGRNRDLRFHNSPFNN
ncbi:CIN8 [Candida margitis]|uniref:CIN8 n=1 Tax=Candida margitis TaxID=1775924 RepID=UPI00222685F7|nr:CIN8 [Candida margitis]KAI5969608.1 CIN8 [Candida margitis]